jgi:DMSO/TMAO reductase YedYZ heme-binding membrane subunit
LEIRDKSKHLHGWLFSVVLFNILLVGWLFFVENSDEQLRLWVIYTALISFFYFVLSFSAGSLYSFSPNSVTTFIRQDRRYVGLSFALSHTFHLAAIVSFYIVMQERPSIIQVVGGGLGYLTIYVMAVTSNDWAVKKLGFRRWKQIHQFGAMYIAIIFMNSYLSTLVIGQFKLTSVLLGCIIVLCFILKIASFFRSKNS